MITPSYVHVDGEPTYPLWYFPDGTITNRVPCRIVINMEDIEGYYGHYLIECQTTPIHCQFPRLIVDKSEVSKYNGD